MPVSTKPRTKRKGPAPKGGAIVKPITTAVQSPAIAPAPPGMECAEKIPLEGTMLQGRIKAIMLQVQQTIANGNAQADDLARMFLDARGIKVPGKASINFDPEAENLFLYVPAKPQVNTPAAEETPEEPDSE